MVRIRLRRVGARNQPSYRIVAADKESPRDGKFLETLGHYNPRTEPSTVSVDEARLFHWLGNGAQPSDAVVKVLRPLGTWDRWERFKGGEALETLMDEAEAAMPEVDPRTRRDDLHEERRAKKAKKKKAKEDKEPAEEAKSKAAKSEVEADAEVVEAAEQEPVEAEQEAPTEAVVEPEQEPEAEQLEEAEAELDSEPVSEQDEPEEGGEEE